MALDKANKNGVWARIIKNAFAPLFIGHVDFVAGNPPWINWRNLPGEYRKSMAPLWTDYGLFTHKGLRARLGAGMDDLSVLMTYVCGNSYCSDNSRLGFVITQTLFQSSGGGQGFRTFKLPTGNYFQVIAVHDFSSFQPFEGATNRTSTVFLAVSNKKNRYPVVYKKVELQAAVSSAEKLAADSPLLKFTDFEASPVSTDETSPWLILPQGLAIPTSKVLGQSQYVGRVGAHSGGAAGVFWVEVLKRDAKLSLISNCWDVGRNKYDPVTASVESKLLRPLLRGRDVRRWLSEPSLWLIIPYEEENDGKAISEQRMKLEFPRAYEYFLNFKKPMLERAHYRQHFKASGQPFWSMYNVGNYTFAPWHVVWREQSSTFQCAVVGGTKAVCPVADHKLVVVPFKSADEAYYLSGILNSSPARFAIESYIVKVQISTHVLQNLNVPTFSKKESLHKELSDLSRECHKIAEAGRSSLRETEAKIDELAAQLWKISSKELRKMQLLLTETSTKYEKEDEE